MILSELPGAVLTAGIPLFLLAFVLVCWALHRQWLVGDNVGDIQGSIEALGKTQKDKKLRKTMDPALGKWFRFGGGFYGLVALYTWLLIETEDIANFVVELGSVIFDFEPGAIFGLVIALAIESIVNFFMAIAWPAHWLGESRNAWVLFPVAYAGYWLGINSAQIAWKRGWVQRVAAYFESA